MPPKFATFADLNRNGGDDHDSSEDQEYFAGGEKRAGAQTYDPNEAFRGGGYRLGNTEAPSGKTFGNQKQATIRLYLYNNGFRIDNGPLRPAALPENQQFLAQVEAQQLPDELRALYPGRDIDVEVVRKPEDYIAPVVPFAGAGLSLGGPAASAAPVNAPAPTVDASQPTTNIQIRLHNGQRQVARLNQSHTVLDLRAYVASLTPGLAFELQNGMPPKRLDNDSLSLKEAGLLNAVVMQRLT